MEFDVTIEIPKGSRNGYEVDHGDRSYPPGPPPSSPRDRLPDRLRLVENTLGEDGDPLDALVILDEPTFPGCLFIRCRAIGMFRDDGRGRRRRQAAVRAVDRPAHVEHLRDIHHVSEFDRLEIQHFFEVYKDLEPGKSVEGADWVGRTEAEAEIERSYKRFKDQGGH